MQGSDKPSEPEGEPDVKKPEPKRVPILESKDKPKEEKKEEEKEKGRGSNDPALARVNPRWLNKPEDDKSEKGENGEKGKDVRCFYCNSRYHRARDCELMWESC